MKDHINLLPDRYAWRSAVKDGLRRWSLVIAISLALVTYLGGKQYSTLQSLRSQQHALQRMYRPVQIETRRIAKLRSQHARLEDELRLVGGLSSHRDMLSVLGIVNRGAAEFAGKLFIERFSFATRDELAAGDVRSQIRPTLTLEGYSINNLSAVQFAAALRDQELFQEVEFDGLEDVSGSAGSRWRYRINCHL